MTAPRRTDRAALTVAASPDEVYAAFADGERLMQWLPPGTMRGRAPVYEFREGGAYRIELSYDEASPEGIGKTESKTDVSTGRFLALEPGKRIVWSIVFSSDDPAFAGEIRMSWLFDRVAEGTKVSIVAEDVPSGISAEDHAEGLRGSLENLARFVRA